MDETKKFKVLETITLDGEEVLPAEEGADPVVVELTEAQATEFAGKVELVPEAE